MSLFRSLALFLCCLFAGSAFSQSIEPADDWQSAETAHFRVNYRAAWRAQAERVAQAAERVYPRITKALDWEPRGRTEILLIDQYDFANGFSTPLPYNIIGVFLAPPDEGELLDNSDWIDLLLAHEFTHTVHLDKVRGAPAVLQHVFGRHPFFYPNIFQPAWAIEGLAVFNEGDESKGEGRLRGPVFEAWLRAEAKTGFLSLREINADGRSWPLSKSYLYGAYFYEFLARRYGVDAIYKGVDRYSGNPPLWPRLHSNPVAATGKTMDALWDEFLVDLAQQVKHRSEPLLRAPEVVGERLAGPMFGVGAVAGLPGGATLAVLDDGIGHAKLVRIAADGQRAELSDINRNAVIDVAADGRVLIAQPDICNWRYLAFDVYRLHDDGSLQQLTHCARLRRAVQAGDEIVGLQQGEGLTRLVVYDAQGEQRSVLWEPPADTTLIDLAASPDGKQISVVSKRAGDWRIETLDLSLPNAPRKLLLANDAPILGIKHGAVGIEFIAVRDGVSNVWRLDGQEWVKLSHTYTRVVSQSGTQADGALALGVVAPGGYELRRMADVKPLSRAPVAKAPAVGTAAPDADAKAALGEPVPYSSWRTLAPRSWFPALTADRGLVAVGASTFGSDALGWHKYAATLQVEATQGELAGSLQYLFQDQHLLTVQRLLTPRAWEGGDSSNDVTAYDRETTAQWLSVLPWLRLDRRIAVGVGAAIDHTERIHAEKTSGSPQRTERLLALLLEYDTSGGNWWSEGASRGQHASLLFETYKPFARDGRDDYDGEVLRLDWRGFVPLGRSVLALRYTEARARGFTERFQLGGAIDPQLQLGLALNNRDITLRGYQGDERELRGTDARVATVEWRTPIADVDRHFMVPAVGLNRLSAAVFFDVGGAWDAGQGPAHYQRGVGVEMLGEIKLLYAMGLQLRVGLARGLDDPKGTHGYLALGRSF